MRCSIRLKQLLLKSSLHFDALKIKETINYNSFSIKVLKYLQFESLLLYEMIA